MTTNSYPTLEEFLVMPMEEVAKVAPATLISALGGTRRSATFAGISPISDNYARWSIKKVMACFNMIFKHGVQHIFVSAIIPKQLQEVKEYVDKLYHWVNWGLAGPEAIANWVHFGWRVRLLGVEGIPSLKASAKRLQEATPQPNAPTVWFTVVAKDESPWNELFSVIYKQNPQTRKEAIRALYGEDIPLATLLLGFGKPQVFPALVPPLLMGNLQCYWLQKVGYNLDQNTFRSILYDYAYIRKTWCTDKTSRAKQALKYRTAWENGPTIGLGMRLGPFWYPAPISLPCKEDGTALAQDFEYLFSH